MTSRSKFDAFLTNKAGEAGADVKDGTLVRDLVNHQSFVEVRTTNGSFESMMAIGCDGMGGPTAKATGLYSRWVPNEVAYAIESEVPAGRQGVDQFMGPERCFDVYFDVSPAGYGWIFPKDDHLTVGVGCRLSRLEDGPRLFKNFVRSLAELNAYVIPTPRAHLIPLGGVVQVPTTGNRVLLAGDSAGFAESLLGEGISFAIQGGQIAAQVAAEARRAERYDANFLNRYERRWRDVFGADLISSYKLARLSYLENYDMDQLSKHLFSARKFHECMIGLMDGSVRHRDVEKKLAWLYFKYKLSKLGIRSTS